MPRLLLLGSGSPHLALLGAFARGSLRDSEVTLVAPAARLLQGGMVPGVVAGRYRTEEAAIDLSALARRAGATLCEAEVTRIDPAARVATLADGGSLSFDIASLALDGVPHGIKLPGVEAHAAHPRSAVRVAELAARLDRLAGEIRPEPRRLIVAGASLRGIELALAARARLDRLEASDLIITMFDGRGDLFGGRLPARADLVLRTLAAHDITLRLGTAVAEVGPDFVRLSDGRVQPADLVIWGTETDPPPLFRASGLPTDPRGQLLIEDTLQVQGNPALFGSGEGVSLAGMPLRPDDSGTGEVLAHNLAAVAGGAGARLRRYRPAGGRLSLLDAGGGEAILFYGPVALASPWAMRLKARLDRRVVARLRGHGTGGEGLP